MPSTQPIALVRMDQQSAMLGPEDDWTGVTSSAKRRRLQNRLNQRAYRNRKQIGARQQNPRSSQSSSRPSSQPSSPVTQQGGGSILSQESGNQDAPATKAEETSSPEDEFWSVYHSGADRSHFDPKKILQVATKCKIGPLEQQELIHELQRWVQRCRARASPTADQLLILVKFNVCRAMMSNYMDLGLPIGEDTKHKEVLSRFTDPTDPVWPARSIPAALQPTRLQRQIPHHPWIDALPSPVMRDNLLRRQGKYRCSALCGELVGFFCEDKGRTGIILWGEPWDVAGWEVTESFVEHWGWTIHGCEQLLRSTNYWRAQRGERPLRVRIVEEVDES